MHFHFGSVRNLNTIILAIPQKKEVFLSAFSGFILCLVFSFSVKASDALRDNHNPFTIKVANFHLLEEEDFSSNLIIMLQESISFDTIRVEPLGKYIDNNAPAKFLEAIQEEENIKTGMIIYGQNDPNANLIDCHIHLVNLTENSILPEIGNETERAHNIRNLNFFIEDKPGIVRTFIIGLINYYANGGSAGNNYFQTAEFSYEGSENKFRSLCNFYIGNNFLISQEYSKAVEAYNTAIKLDKEFSYALWNSGVACKLNNDNIMAAIFFNKAHKLEPELKTPITFEKLKKKDINPFNEPGKNPNRSPIAFFPRNVATILYFTESTYFEVYDTFGRLVKSGTNKELDVTAMNPGTYYLNFDDKVEKFFRK